jgi:hypothetical protein
MPKGGVSNRQASRIPTLQNAAQASHPRAAFLSSSGRSHGWNPTDPLRVAALFSALALALACNI